MSTFEIKKADIEIAYDEGYLTDKEYELALKLYAEDLAEAWIEKFEKYKSID